METGGESFDLSVPEGYETIADRILRRDGSGSLANLGRSIMDDDSVFEVPIDVAPGTSELDMVFFRELPITVFRLTNPDGFESSTGDRRSSTITEFHHVVIWELEDPVPGRWNLEVRGGQGHFSANAHYTNRYGIEFQSSGAAPVGQPTNIVAMVTDNGQRSPVDATLTASITDPSGTSILHDLNDEGRDGDATASDGFFSATIPPRQHRRHLRSIELQLDLARHRVHDHNPVLLRGPELPDRVGHAGSSRHSRARAADEDRDAVREYRGTAVLGSDQCAFRFDSGQSGGHGHEWKSFLNR